MLKNQLRFVPTRSGIFYQSQVASNEKVSNTISGSALAVHLRQGHDIREALQLNIHRFKATVRNFVFHIVST